MKTFIELLISSLFLLSCAVAEPKAAEKSQTAQVCEPTGCSGQVCTEKGKSVLSTCLMLPHYECFKRTRCEVQTDGKCGWTPTQEFQACLKRYQPAQIQ